MPGSHDWSSAVAADPSGNFVICGQTDGGLFSPTSRAGHDIWVAKLGSEGDIMWTYQVSRRSSARGPRGRRRLVERDRADFPGCAVSRFRWLEFSRQSSQRPVAVTDADTTGPRGFGGCSELNRFPVALGRWVVLFSAAVWVSFPLPVRSGLVDVSPRPIATAGPSLLLCRAGALSRSPAAWVSIVRCALQRYGRARAWSKSRYDQSLQPVAATSPCGSR